jgi:long-chain acyl-CoA synthetase
MAGYWRNPEETKAVLNDGWLRTGDVARMDPDGCFAIVDRKKDLIITAGYNVYPREVEEVLFAHPGVREAAVVGVPHATRGEVVKAFVVLDAEAEEPLPDKAELLAFVRERLAAYKVPRQLVFMDELPKTPAGKVLRRKLRAPEAEAP